MFTDTQIVTNSGSEPLTIWLEPVAQDYQLSPGKSLTFVGTSAQQGRYEVVDYGNKIGIYDWPGAATDVFDGDTLIDTVPSFRDDNPPSGISIRQFVENVFGGPGGVGEHLTERRQKRSWWKFW
jgi:hypothetical protein